MRLLREEFWKRRHIAKPHESLPRLPNGETVLGSVQSTSVSRNNPDQSLAAYGKGAFLAQLQPQLPPIGTSQDAARVAG